MLNDRHEDLFTVGKVCSEQDAGITGYELLRMTKRKSGIE